MSLYDLPTYFYIKGKKYPIRCGWRHIIKIIVACGDPQISDRAKSRILLRIFYPDWKSIPSSDISEALEKACDFIDCGMKEDNENSPKMIDWERDAGIIIPEINKVANMEIRMDPDIHWWTVFGWFMKIEDGLLLTVLHIRWKKAKHKKLEDYEKEFYRENRALIDMKEPETEEIRAEKDSILKYL